MKPLNRRTLSGLSKNRLSILRRLLQKKYREKERLFLVEGSRVCQQAIETSAPIQEIVVTEKFTTTEHFSAFFDFSNQTGIPINITSTRSFAELTDTETPQGILAVLKMPEINPDSVLSLNSAAVVALDRLQDPGNLGTILRTAEWLGCNAAFCSKGTVDCYNPKVLRSAMGATFTLPILQDVDLDKEIIRFKRAGFITLGTSANEGIRPEDINKSPKFVLLVGSEVQGLSGSLTKIIDQMVTIPGMGKMESLNAAVATGIVLYELTKP